MAITLCLVHFKTIHWGTFVDKDPLKLDQTLCNFMIVKLLSPSKLYNESFDIH